jgi:hypothetical protein
MEPRGLANAALRGSFFKCFNLHPLIIQEVFFMESLTANIDIFENAFSVAVAAYLLVRMESRLDGLTNAIVRLNASVDFLSGRAERGFGPAEDER